MQNIFICIPPSPKKVQKTVHMMFAFKLNSFLYWFHYFGNHFCRTRFNFGMRFAPFLTNWTELNTCRAELQSYLCVQSRRAGEQTDFRIAISPVDVRGGSGCLGNQLALKCGAAPWPRLLYKYPHGFDVNTRQPENMMPLCKSTRVLCSW